MSLDGSRPLGRLDAGFAGLLSSTPPQPLLEPESGETSRPDREAEYRAVTSPTLHETFLQTVRSRVGSILLGKDDAIELALTTLVAGGHLLIEDRPGVGKTLLARTLARVLGLEFQRLQCTADLLPADILGAQVYEADTGKLSFRPGPIFTSVLVADELNRTPPRTQSALLECMAEGRVSIGRETHKLPEIFFVIATQNPLSFAGTYPLPENQLDRFLMRIHLGYPDAEREIDAVVQEDGHRALGRLEPMSNPDHILEMRNKVEEVKLVRELVEWIVEIARRTRTHSDISLGASTRAAQALHRAARARALLDDRDFVVPSDIEGLLGPVFGHRIVLQSRDADATSVLTQIVEEIGRPE